ncbi:MAG: VacJ family lipoprotein [Methylophagaceae bacterium]
MTTLTSLIRISLLTAALLLSGCATTQHADGVNDPLEGYNRFMYSFNDVADRAVIKPAAQVYDAVLPDPIQKGVSNFFSNLNEITVIINDLLQLKFRQAFHDTGRFVLNSTVGVAGIFDVAGYSGYEKHDEDFGQTLGSWGVGTGPYVVLPFFGPRNVRDTVGLVGDIYTDPITYVDDNATRNALVATQVIDLRANLLGTEKVLDEATDDEYIFVRDAYLQRRQHLVYDGNPPEEDFDVFSDE